MAQTPISASVNFSGTTPSTIYTVPTGKTAVVNTVIPTSVVGSAATVTLNKVSSGTVYPLALGVQTSYPQTSGTYYYLNAVPTVNLLPSPITLTAGESISLSTSTSTYFKDALGVSNSAFKLTNGNYVNGNYVVLGQDTSTGYGLVLTSTDGLTWTQRTFNFYVVCQDITYGNGYYVICNQSSTGKIHYSTDLATWTEVSLPAGAAMYSITFGNNKFLVAGNGLAFYATSTPLSWTQVVFPNGDFGSTINAVSYIGTNYVFGTAGPTFTTTDFSTFVPVNYMYDASGWCCCTANATRFYSTTNVAPSSIANRVVQYTTDGVTFTNGTTVTTNGTDSQVYVVALGNGAMLLMPQYWNGASLKYTKSSDGLTWTNVTGLNISNYTTAAYSYTQSVYPIIDSTRNYIGISLNGTKIQLNSVASDGTVTATSSINFNANNLTGGNFSFAGNPTTGTWIAGCSGYYATDTQSTGWYYGSGPTSGNDATGNFNAVYKPSYGGITTCHYRPGSNGFMIGMGYGYVGTTTSQSSGMGNVQRPTSSASAIASFACDGNTASSAIAYIQTDGYGAVSRDQGNTWTTMRVPGDSFASQDGYATKCLQYVNGLWIAQNTSGQTFVSTNALVWTTAPTEVTNMATLNSNNVFLSSKGIFTSSGSSVTSFTRRVTNAYTNYPSTRNMIYASSKYLLGYGGSVIQSADLVTWSSASVSSTAINDVTYWSTNDGTALLTDGSNNFLAIGAKRNSPTGEGKIGKPTTINAALVVGNVTAGIVEIS